MQVEVDDEQKISVRRDVHRRWKKSERSFADYPVIFRRVLPDQTKRTAVRDGNVIELLIRRDNNTVWPIDVHGHIAGLQIVIDARAVWSEANQSDLVSRF